MGGLAVVAALVVVPADVRAGEEWPAGTWSPDVWREDKPVPPPARARPIPPPLTPPPPRRRVVHRAPSRTFLLEYGVGPTMFAALGPHSTTRELGGAFQLRVEQPLVRHFGVGLRFGWALTSWKRTERVARPGYKLASLITEGLGNVWGELGERHRIDEEVGIGFAAVVITIFAIIPYAIAGAFYLVSPLAATSSFETAATFDVWPGHDPRRTPYLGAGGAAMLYVLPDTGRAFGGVGPTASLGYRFGNISLGLVGTWLPHGGHGRDASTPNAHIFTSTLTLSIMR